jgi:hypothetical protein
MNDEQRKRTKELQAQTQKHLERMKLMTQSERIEFTRTRPDGQRRDITIYFDALTEE